MSIKIVEVGPRDGLQNESFILSVETRIELIKRLYSAGVMNIEAGSFVRADRIPQLAESMQVLSGIAELSDLTSIWLTPNERGFFDASSSGASHVAVFVAASETFNNRNVNCSIDKSLDQAALIIEQAKKQNIKVRGYVSTIAGCPFEGSVNIETVVKLTKKLIDLGCYEVSLGDTIGVATPKKTREIISAVAGDVDVNKLAFHGHDTYGMGIANAIEAINCGLKVVDSSLGGLGGCPFAGKAARGNLATEDLVYALGSDELEGNIDIAKLVDTSWWLAEFTGHSPHSLVANAMRGR